jgi:hypothetical protein
MGEIHNIAGPPRAEPLPTGRVGARVRIPLTGTPSPRWSRVVTARLSAALSGHPAVGHLELSDLVQGADLVLEGVEGAEAERLGDAISDALSAANRDAQPGRAEDRPATNMTQAQADAIAHRIKVDYEPRAAKRASGVSFPGR